MKPKALHDAFVQLLDGKLQPLIADGRELNLVTCTEIYTTIFDTWVELVTETQTQMTNEALNYLAMQYYDGILVNGNQELDPFIFTQRAKLDDIATKELAFLAVAMAGTDFALPILAEIKRRS